MFNIFTVSTGDWCRRQGSSDSLIPSIPKSTSIPSMWKVVQDLQSETIVEVEMTLKEMQQLFSNIEKEAGLKRIPIEEISRRKRASRGS